MKRKEEIEKAAQKSGWISKSLNLQSAFIDGAKWADKKILDRACGWLKSKLNYVENRIGEPVVCSFDYETIAQSFYEWAKKNLEL